MNNISKPQSAPGRHGRRLLRVMAASAVIASMMPTLSSCDDFFDLKPENELVLDEMWKSESDVLSVTGSVYRQMQEGGFMNDLFVWGEFRSDNVILGNGDGGDLSNIASLNLLPSNGYAYWGNVYTVINICNTIIHYAPEARANDPSFSESAMNGYIAEAKGVRAFCYFLLVRTFRDVPFVLNPVIDDTETFQVAQSDPDDVINTLIEDLKKTEPTAFTTLSTKVHTKGRMTQNAIRALIADMCLWQGRYSECIDYCDRILRDNLNPLSLETGTDWARKVFIDGNSSESIFELQFNNSGATVGNSSLVDFYGSDNSTPRMAAFDFSTSELFNTTDTRQWDFFYNSNSTSVIKKFVSYRTDPNSKESVNSWSYTDLGSSARNVNWILYRLPDVYLMKAEALVESGGSLQTAYDLVSHTFDRANPDLEPGSIDPTAVNSTDAMRNLVFDERQRELMFEGKRYFDLLRRILRDRSQFSTLVTNYLVPKYNTLDQATITRKLSELDALYFPIKDTELKSNLLLKQNPFYRQQSDISRD